MGEYLAGILGRPQSAPEQISGIRGESIRGMTTMEEWAMRARQAYASQSLMERLDQVPEIGAGTKVLEGRKLLPKYTTRGDRVGPIVNGELLPSARPKPISPTEVSVFELLQLIPPWAFGKGAKKPWNK